MLELYQAEWCPYSTRVRKRLTQLGVDFVARQVEAEPERRNAMRERTGTDVIPALVTEDGDVVSDAGRIVAYLDERYPETPETKRHRAQERAHEV